MKLNFNPIVLCIALIAGSWSTSTLCASSSPLVVASITPFYDLVASVMEGVGIPKLLVKAGASPHQYTLRPSDIQMIKDADIIFWAGPDLESFLVKPLSTNNLKKEAQVIQFDKTPGLLLLPIRQSANWDPHDHHDNHEGHDDHSHQHHGTIDMHFWLDPNNARLLIDNIVKQLAKIDAPNASIYQKNGKKIKHQLAQLDLTLKAKLKNVSKIPYIVFHDAYQYFEHHYGLNGVGAITLHPEVPPSVQRLSVIRETIQKTHAQCVFTEPQFEPKLVQSIIEDTHVKSGVLDPLGPEPKNGQNGYFILLETITKSLSHCLQTKNP